MRKIVQINLASSEKLNFDKIKLILYPRVRNSMIYVPDNIVHTYIFYTFSLYLTRQRLPFAYFHREKFR